MSKKRKDGYFKKSFTFNEKRYYVYAKTKQELNEKEYQKRAELEKQTDNKQNPTLQEYYDRWKIRRYSAVSETTIRGQQMIMNVVGKIELKSTNKPFVEKKIKKIDLDDLYEVQQKLMERNTSRTTNDYMAFINHLFRDAAKERYIDYNPFVLLKQVRKTEEECRDTIHRALTKEEQSKFFSSDYTKNCYYYNAFRLALLTGMRCGEIGAITNKDIKNGRIYVERTVTRSENGSYVMGDRAKTKAGKRTIPMTDAISSVIEDQIQRNKLLLNEKAEKMNEDVIFTTPTGGLIHAGNPDREIRKICKKLEIEPFTMHGLRATFATRAIESGMKPKTLQEILGHKNFNITMSLYGHVLEDTKDEEMNKINIDI